MALEAGTKALEDAGIPYDAVEEAYVGYCYGDSTCGQRAVYGLGLTGIPVVNVNNNCSTGSSALYLARRAVQGGLAECALALGFEKMEKGSLGVKYTDRTNPIDKHAMAMFELCQPEASPPRRCSATPGASTWSATGRSPTTTRGSAGRTTSTRSTTPTRSSRTSTRSRTSRRPRSSTSP